MAVSTETLDTNAGAPNTSSDKFHTPHDRFANAGALLDEALVAATRACEYVQLAGEYLSDTSINEQLANMNEASESWKAYQQFPKLFEPAESLRAVVKGTDMALDGVFIKCGMAHQAFQAETEFRKNEDSIESQMMDEIVQKEGEKVLVMMKAMLAKKLGDQTLPRKLRLKLEQIAEEENDASDPLLPGRE